MTWEWIWTGVALFFMTVFILVMFDLIMDGVVWLRDAILDVILGKEDDD